MYIYIYIYMIRFCFHAIHICVYIYIFLKMFKRFLYLLYFFLLFLYIYIYIMFLMFPYRAAFWFTIECLEVMWIPCPSAGDDLNCRRSRTIGAAAIHVSPHTRSKRLRGQEGVDRARKTKKIKLPIITYMCIYIYIYIY